MYARTTTIRAAQPSSIDAGIAHVRDNVMPALEGFDGYVGLSLLVDRSSGDCITTSAWKTDETMRASTAAVRQIRSRAAQTFGGNPDVDEWEIAAMHRDRPAAAGACVRVTWAKLIPDRVGPGIEMFKKNVLPALKALEGYCSASLLVSRASGRAVTSAVYDSIEAMERNRDQLDRIRASASQESNAEVLQEHEYELAIAHLHVPEMA